MLENSVKSPRIRIFDRLYSKRGEKSETSLKFPLPVDGFWPEGEILCSSSRSVMSAVMQNGWVLPERGNCVL
jgi:hypothetical protein